MMLSLKEIRYGTKYKPNSLTINYLSCKIYKYDIKQYGIINLPNVSGAYILEFSNGYYYIGSTNNICRRINNHIANLLFKDLSSIKWYKDVKIESVKDMNIYIFETVYYNELEEYLIQNAKESLYNKIT